jgi:hypothetical protein
MVSGLTAVSRETRDISSYPIIGGSTLGDSSIMSVLKMKN